MATTITIPFEIGEKVYVINEFRNRKTHKYEWTISEGIVECVHIGRKLKYNKYVTDSYMKVRSTLIHALLPPIPIALAERYVSNDRNECVDRIRYFEQLQEDGLYEN